MDTANSTNLTVTLNGRKAATSAQTLAEFIAENGFGGSKIATAVNGEFVPERARAATRLNPGDTIEVVSARQGG